MRKFWNSSGYTPSHSNEDAAVQTSTATKRMETLLVEENGLLRKVEDKGNHVYLMFLMFGIGALLPWNMFLNISHDYYTTFKLMDNGTGTPYSSNFQYSMTVAAQVPNLVFSFANIFLAAKGDLTARMRICLAIVQAMVAITMVFIYIDTSDFIATFYYVTLLSIVFLNAANGLFQNSLFGLASSFPFKYTNAILIGQNFCGTVVSLLALLTKVVANNIESRAVLYFGLASIAIITCFILLNVIKKSAYFKRFDVVEANAYSDFEGEITTWEDIRIVFSRSKMQFANIFFLFFVTLSLFPSICMYVLAVNTGETYDFIISEMYFMDVGTFLNFNLFAFLGSLSANYVRLFGPKTIWIAVAVRVWFLFYFPSANYFPPQSERIYGPVFESTWFFILNVTLMAFSSGYLSSLIMMYAPRAHDEPRIQRMAGMIAAFFLIAGVVSGLVFAWGISLIVTDPLAIVPVIETIMANGTAATTVVPVIVSTIAPTTAIVP
ncbi:hypothetical protein GCK72_003573 [Caenorhabditis remanei]|uniref:Uncharacterized protein n=1 Tax=Caenorhabditis remanei TaxID=31234 RepID=A0A6A5HVN5_CAERE|nr:hypothetical protein GCK72_003573 [Caenorhabditis remanei]KAF1771745.1 hypothetical protein GCK72_003573 [Caenorhabditis remanei]